MTRHLAGALGACLAFLTLAATAAERKLDRSFEVEPGGRLTVEADSCDITVRGTDARKVVVRVRVSGSAGSLEEMTLDARQQGDGVLVTVKRGQGWLGRLSFGAGSSGHIEVEVPRRYGVDLETSGGDLSVTHLEGTVSGKTSGGDIGLADVRGTVRMQTSGGDVEIERIAGPMQVGTSGGSIEGRALEGELEAKTSGGGIRLTGVHGKVRARTSSGDVIAHDVRGDVDLSTSGGDVHAERIDGRIAARTSGGNVKAELAGANRGIRAATSGGNIVLRLPADTAGSLDASTSGGSVQSELPVTTTEAGRNALKGTLNGGGEPIHARTSGGNIRVLAAGGEKE